MDTPFEISQWITTFETSESRKCQTLKWVSLPVTLGAGYEALLAEFGDEAPAIYGAWILLVGIAATAPNRGVLADSKGRPYGVEYYARKSGFSVELFRRLITWASDPDIGWLVSYIGVPPKERAVPTGRKPGDNRDGTGSSVEQLSSTVSPPTNPPSAPPTAQQPTAPLVVDEATRPSAPQPTPPTNENPAISHTGSEPGGNREETGTEPGGNQCLHNITLHHHTEHHLTRQNNTSSINQSNPDNRNSEGPVPVPRPVQDRIDRLMDDLTFRGEVVELANKLRTGRIHRHPFWKTATREDLWRIVFVGQAFGPECLGECIRKIATGGIEKPGRYIDASFRKMLHEHHGVSWEQLRNHIPVPAPPKPEPVPVS